MTGYEPEENMRVCVSTKLAQYWLGSSSDIYQDIFHVLNEKVSVTKVIYTCLHRILERNEDEDYTYDNLIEDFENENNNELFEQDLLNCGKFVVDQIRSYEEQADEDESVAIDCEAFKQLAKYSNADGYDTEISR